jgi:small-conductance mechanosensitive channel
MDAGDWLQYEFLGNTLLTWLTSLGTFAAVWSLLTVAHRMLTKRLRAFAENSTYSAVYIVDRVVARTQPWLPLLLAFFMSARLVISTAIAAALIQIAFTIGILLQVGLWATGALSAWLTVRRRQQLSQSPGDVAMTDLLRVVLAGFVWVVIVLMMLDNLGINVTTLIAGLGIGGVAVALAAQSVLADLFASLAIALDRPLRVGDSIVIDDFTGTVERVGLKTTRLRSLSGEQLVFSNADLLSSRIRNFGQMKERRVEFSLALTYRTRPSDLRRIPAIVQAVVCTEPKVRFQRAHFSRYGDFAVVFNIVYHVLSPDPNLHADVQHRINLAVYERFAAEGIEFAYPTQTLYVSALGAEDASLAEAPARRNAVGQLALGAVAGEAASMAPPSEARSARDS